MFEIKVLDFQGAKALTQSGWPTRVISLIKEDMPDWSDDTIQHLRLQFDDVHNIFPGYVHPTLFHFNRILSFTQDLTDDDKVLVHCIAGISRSTSAAIAICMQHGMSYVDAYNHIATQRPKLAPNRLITEYTDDHFGLDGKYYCFVEERVPFKHITGWLRDASQQTGLIGQKTKETK
jgi:predicted protein tyrosine phosphatase